MTYILMYSTTLLVSFALTLILFLYHSRYWNPVTHVPLQCIYFLNMTSALMCVVWSLVDGRPQYSHINYIANIIEFNCMGFCGFCWLLYCLKFVKMPRLKTVTVRLLLTAPIAIIMLMIVTTPLTHWAFYIDGDGFFRRGTYYFIQQTGYLYLLVSSVICLLYRKKCPTSSERQRLCVLSMFPLSPAFFGIVQIIAPSGMAPTLQFSILISLLLVFVDELDQKITRDSLTQITNRFEFERILQHRIENFQINGPHLYVFMCDLDDFKSINDTYGHQQGDVALKMVGTVLTRTAAKYSAVCARMSGDEFISMLEADSLETAAAFQEDLEKNLAASCINLPYTLKISIGMAEYDGHMTLMQLLNQADTYMYDQKRRHKHLE